jgi:AraC-like DNA-binding protein
MFGAEQYEIYDQESSLAFDCLSVDGLRVDNKIEFGGGGATTTFVSGFFDVESLDARHLLDVLPKVLHLKSERSRTRAFESVLELLAAEAETPGLGSGTVVRRLFELLFVHSVRAFAEQFSMPKRGWLAAVTDKGLAAAVEAIHGDLKTAWTVEMLARQSGMSRSAFAARFKDVVGQAPLAYLTEWRISKAARLVESGQSKISVIAHSVGYQSEAAFTKAFRKVMGATPSDYRKIVDRDNAAREVIVASLPLDG